MGAIAIPAADEAHVWVTDLTRADVAIRSPEALLTSAELARAARQLDAGRRRRLVLAEAALRSVAAGYLGGDARDVAIARRCPACGGPHGARRATGPEARTPLDLSSSRSGELALFAVSAGGRIGVDVELVDAAFDWPRTAAVAFHPRELARIGRAGDFAAACFAAWTRKEAYLKALGTGLAADPAGMEVPPDGSDWCVRDLDVGPLYAAALVADGTRTVVVQDAAALISAASS